MDLIVNQWTQSPNWVKVGTFLTLPTVGFLTARFLDEYQGWLDLGPGGLPHNLKGYLLNLLVTGLYAKQDTKSLEVYDQPDKYAPRWKDASEEEKSTAQKSFLKGSLSQRSGPEAKAIHYCAPQREKNFDEYVDPELKQAYAEAIERLAEKHSHAIEWKTSVLEKHGPAMFLKETYSLPTLIAKCQREVAHIHDSDQSGHMLLSFADAKEVIDKGWGERHRMSGSGVIPLGYTMLYVPRKASELEVFMRIFEASLEYAQSNGRN